MMRVGLNASLREQLADCRTLLASSAHNAGAAARGGDDALQALGNAAAQAEQALAGLRRIQAELDHARAN